MPYPPNRPELDQSDPTDQVVAPPGAEGDPDLGGPTDVVDVAAFVAAMVGDTTGLLTEADLVKVSPPRGLALPRARSVPPPLPGRPARGSSTQLGARGILPPATTQFAAGTVDGEPPMVSAFGAYPVHGVLASGSMGVVYRGEHPTLRCPVAIKTLHPKLQKSPVMVSRFFAEAVATARVAHLNVVRYFDFGYDARGAAYLVTELLDGETLRSRLDCERQLDVALAIEIVVQVGLALTAAHEQGIVHRDLKPDNIYLCATPNPFETPHVKLLDFGVAKVDDHGPGTMHTQQGDLLGTPSYMAPEQGLSASSSDARSDVYSLGCILFEMVCGTLPFGGNLVETLLAHQTSERPAARHYNGRVSEALDALIARMIARAPEERPQSMAEVVEALLVIQEDEASVSIPTPTPWRTVPERLARVTRPCARRATTDWAEARAPRAPTVERATARPPTRPPTRRTRGATAGVDSPPRALYLVLATALVIGVVLGAMLALH